LPITLDQPVLSQQVKKQSIYNISNPTQIADISITGLTTAVSQQLQKHDPKVQQKIKDAFTQVVSSYPDSDKFALFFNQTFDACNEKIIDEILPQPATLISDKSGDFSLDNYLTLDDTSVPGYRKGTPAKYKAAVQSYIQTLGTAYTSDVLWQSYLSDPKFYQYLVSRFINSTDTFAITHPGASTQDTMTFTDHVKKFTDTLHNPAEYKKLVDYSSTYTILDTGSLYEKTRSNLTIDKPLHLAWTAIDGTKYTTHVAL
jgi:hypothetical protein